ncbi:MAG: DNA polymerase I [Bdellovibrio sp.]
MKRLIIVDVSSFIFRAFFAIRPLHAPDGTPVNAVHGVLSMLTKLIQDYEPTHLFIAKDSAGGSFRNEVYEEYKANRGEPPEDLIPQFDLIKKLIEKLKIPYLMHDDFEADDIIGSACTQWKNNFDEILIASGDKDLMQFVGGNVKMLDTMKDQIYDEKGVFEKMGVRPDQIVDYLSMVGDSSDNIPGLPGIGSKGAAKLLEQYGSISNILKHKDELKGKKVIEAFNDHLDKLDISQKLVKIVTDVDLGIKPEELEYHFVPNQDLIDFLNFLGFKSQLEKLQAKMKQINGKKNGNKVTEESSLLSHSEGHRFNQGMRKLDDILKLISPCALIGIDTLFDSMDPISKKPLLLGMSLDGVECFIFNAQEDLEGFKKLMRAIWFDPQKIVISMRPKDEIIWCLENLGETCSQHLDVIQAHFVKNPEANHSESSIFEECGVEILHKELFTIKDGILKNSSDLEREELKAFIASRAAGAYTAGSMLRESLNENKLLSVYEGIDDPLIDVLAKMEHRGIELNLSFFDEFEGTLAKKISAVEENIFTHCGGVSFNLNSPKQVGEVLFEKLALPVIKKTKTGYSTDVEVLEELDSRNLSPVPGLLMEHRELNKLQSTYVKALPQQINTKSGRLHTHFNQHVAQTGRLSSTNPNLQNIPIRTEMGRMVRKGFVAAKGKVLIGFDYSQVELRLLAHFSEDQTMIDAFKRGEDIHRQTASEVLGVPLDKVTSEERSKAKAVNFGLMYGQSSFGLAQQLRISRTEAKEYITRYFQRFHKVKSYLDSLKEFAERTGYAETFHGRKRFLADIHSQNRTMKAMAERVAINSPIQGTAADIIKLAMVKIEKAMNEKKLQSQMLLQVHDELIFEVVENEIDIVKSLVRDGMENVVELKVPLKVDMGMGDNWFDLK